MSLRIEVDLNENVDDIRPSLEAFVKDCLEGKLRDTGAVWPVRVVNVKRAECSRANCTKPSTTTCKGCSCPLCDDCLDVGNRCRVCV
jgi:hypothetical protein